MVRVLCGKISKWRIKIRGGEGRYYCDEHGTSVVVNELVKRGAIKRGRLKDPVWGCEKEIIRTKGWQGVTPE